MSFKDQFSKIFRMSEKPEDVITKQQAILDQFFNLLGNFAYDKAKEFLDKERDIGVKNHIIAPFFSSALTAFSNLAAAEKNYANIIYVQPKGFMRKDSSLKSMYEALMNEYKRLEERHYITPVTTPAISPTPSSNSPTVSSGLPSPSISVAGESESSGSVSSSVSVASSAKSSMHPSFLGEDILENLASHLCGQLLNFVQARLKTMEFYESMCAMSSEKVINFEKLLDLINEIVTTNVKLFHHPMLSPLKSVFSSECEIVMKLLESEIHMQNWRFLPSLLSLHDAHTKLTALLNQPKDLTVTMRRATITTTYKSPPIPPLYTWLRTMKGALVSKFTLYFHEILSKQTVSPFWTKVSTDYFSKIVAFSKRHDVICAAIVLETNGLDDYTGHGYRYPGKQSEAPKGLDSFPPVLSYPANCFSQEKHASHWPSVVMIMNKEEKFRNADTIISFYDPRINATFYMLLIESRLNLVLIFEHKTIERDSHIQKYMHALCAQLRGNKLYASFKPGAK